MDQYYSDTADKDCLFMSNGKWGRVEDKRCTRKLHKYLCQKGVSESKFWNNVEGKEYAYYELEDQECDVTWDYALSKCEEVGGTLASIPSVDVYNALLGLFLRSMTTTYGFWIGLKRKGNNLEWTLDGETSTYEYWYYGEPYYAYDCTRVNRYHLKWAAKDCNNGQSYRAGLCVKGSTASWAKSGRRRRSTKLLNGTSDIASLVKSARIKRGTALLNGTTEVASLVKSGRIKRSTDVATSREITCEPLWGNTAGYWSFSYKVPAYCHSNYIV